jgi:hypothetical protein
MPHFGKAFMVESGRKNAFGWDRYQKNSLRLEGFESSAVTLASTSTLRQSHRSRAAKSGAVNPTLQELIDAWPELTDAVRGAILVIVRAARVGN